MKTTIKIYNFGINRPNLGSTELEIYDLRDGKKSDGSWYTELQGDFASLSQRLQSQEYQCSEAVFIKS
jgi:hypothetical protein